MTGLTWHQIATTFALICFLLATLEHKKYNWLGFSLTIWLLGAYYSAQILPGIFGITHWFNAYLLHGYIFMGSIFFWINHVFRLPIIRTKIFTRQFNMINSPIQLRNKI